MKKLNKFLLCILLVVSVMISALGCSWINTGNPPDTEPPETPPVTPPYGCLEVLPDSVEQSDSIILNSIPTEEREESNLTVEEAVTMVKRSSVAIRTSSGSGSGTIVDIDDGVNQKNTFYILTCHHVISDTTDIVVYVPDTNYRYGENEDYTFTGKIGGERTAGQEISLVGGDFKSDVAVLKLYVENDEIANTIVKAKIMDKKYLLTEGQTVFAVGNPTGVLPGTVTTGVISYVNRETSVEKVGSMVLNQISVLINPGSSGGALFNTYGELVGITNAGNASNMTYYAIPHVITQTPKTDKGFINIAKQLVATCSDVNYGYVSGRKATIGFSFSQTQGANPTIVVTDVTANSVAEKSGLLKGDVITHIKVGDKVTPVNTVAACSAIIDALNPGDSFTFTLVRETETVYITFTIYQEYFKDTGVYPNN